ncbi:MULTISPECIES: DUF6289 family protein [Pseudoxanthomonas]|uniref:DUF6289 family protein n=1 Tax=Pseudoxanthomonas TaxID=83618 RepID=UPI00161D5F30|nr:MULTISPECIES: DUF6289 family protein [Pseudoxanthomonas]MBB3278044.1 ABC-type cobalamin transport system permease subunit [Pseudoxanthomonas sp. OG2]MBD9375731.1 hypothetical protein [Pseudoxanthomonas sp. PXM04]MBV7474712.1 hypothetical protein [Pseudoxanthomonas sp. PXM05]UBB25743.1 hypothetical protein LAG73_01235 [Pseudoxanthomonas japonensis]
MKTRNLLALSSLLLLVASFPAISGRQYASHTTYFDENGSVVGWEVIPCQGPPTTWGVVTNNYHEDLFECS